MKNAAWHYFGRKPAELNLAECLFLSSLLPKPREYHKLYEKGELPQSWMMNIRQLMDIAHKNGRISDKELEDGKVETIVFHKEDAPPPVPRAPVTRLALHGRRRVGGKLVEHERGGGRRVHRLARHVDAVRLEVEREDRGVLLVGE